MAILGFRSDTRGGPVATPPPLRTAQIVGGGVLAAGGTAVTGFVAVNWKPMIQAGGEIGDVLRLGLGVVGAVGLCAAIGGAVLVYKGVAGS